MALYDSVDLLSQDTDTGGPYGASPQPAYQVARPARNYLLSGPQGGITGGADASAHASSLGNFLHQAGIGIHSYVDAAGQWLRDRFAGADNPASFDEDVAAARARLDSSAPAHPMLATPSSPTAPSNGASIPQAPRTTVPSTTRSVGMGQLSDFGRLALKAMSQGLGEDPETVNAAHDNFTKLTGRFPTAAELADFKSLGMLHQLAGADIGNKQVPALLNPRNDLYSGMFAIPGVQLPQFAQQVIGRQLLTPSTTGQGVSNLLRAGISAKDIRKMAAAIGGATGEHISSFLPPAR